MKWIGHKGFTLCVTSALCHTLMTYKLMSFVEALIFIVVATVFSVLPDVDLNFEVAHRKYTHNVLFAFLVSLTFAYSLHVMGFNAFLYGSAVFTGMITHVFLDLFTCRRFNPVAPFLPGSVAFGVVYADDERVNVALWKLGVLSFLVFVLGWSLKWLHFPERYLSLVLYSLCFLSIVVIFVFRERPCSGRRKYLKVRRARFKRVKG